MGFPIPWSDIRISCQFFNCICKMDSTKECRGFPSVVVNCLVQYTGERDTRVHSILAYQGQSLKIPYWEIRISCFQNIFVVCLLCYSRTIMSALPIQALLFRKVVSSTRLHPTTLLQFIGEYIWKRGMVRPACLSPALTMEYAMLNTQNAEYWSQGTCYESSFESPRLCSPMIS